MKFLMIFFYGDVTICQYPLPPFVTISHQSVWPTSPSPGDVIFERPLMKLFGELIDGRRNKNAGISLLSLVSMVKVIRKYFNGLRHFRLICHSIVSGLHGNSNTKSVYQKERLNPIQWMLLIVYNLTPFDGVFTFILLDIASCTRQFFEEMDTKIPRRIAKG